MKRLYIPILSLLLTASAFSATAVSLKLSGDGAVDATTIQAGKKVSFDIYLENDGNFKGVTLGFKVISNGIKTVVHPADSGNGLNEHGDVKAYNGWQDESVWDMLGGLYVAKTDWDGTLPDILGFGGISKGKGYMPHKLEKKLSFDLIIDTPGEITIDSAFFAPSGRWKFAPPATTPKWGGPYTFKVVK